MKNHWDKDKNVDDFLTLASNLEAEDQESRAEAVRYLISRVKTAEAALSSLVGHLNKNSN